MESSNSGVSIGSRCDSTPYETLRSHHQRHTAPSAKIATDMGGQVKHAAKYRLAASQLLGQYSRGLEGVSQPPCESISRFWTYDRLSVLQVALPSAGFRRTLPTQIRVELPPDYNDIGTWPVIRFTSSVFNPMVSPKTGELDLKSVFPEWVPGKHYMVTALTYLKKVFYMKDFSFPRPANAEAQALFQVTIRGSFTSLPFIILEHRFGDVRTRCPTYNEIGALNSYARPNCRAA